MKITYYKIVCSWCNKQYDNFVRIDKKVEETIYVTKVSHGICSKDYAIQMSDLETKLEEGL